MALTLGYPELIRHLAFFIVFGLFVLVVGQNWGVILTVVMIKLYMRYDGRWLSVPFKKSSYWKCSTGALSAPEHFPPRRLEPGRLAKCAS